MSLLFSVSDSFHHSLSADPLQPFCSFSFFLSLSLSLWLLFQFHSSTHTLNNLGDSLLKNVELKFYKQSHFGRGGWEEIYLCLWRDYTGGAEAGAMSGEMQPPKPEWACSQLDNCVIYYCIVFNHVFWISWILIQEISSQHSGGKLFICLSFSFSNLVSLREYSSY